MPKAYSHTHRNTTGYLKVTLNDHLQVSWSCLVCCDSYTFCNSAAYSLTTLFILSNCYTAPPCQRERKTEVVSHKDVALTPVHRHKNVQQFHIDVSFVILILSSRIIMILIWPKLPITKFLEKITNGIVHNNRIQACLMALFWVVEIIIIAVTIDYSFQFILQSNILNAKSPWTSHSYC